MSANVLDVVQSTLDQGGLRDVKFFFSLDVLAKPHSDVANNVANVLETYLAGHRNPLPLIGDSKKALQAEPA